MHGSFSANGTGVSVLSSAQNESRFTMIKQNVSHLAASIATTTLGTFSSKTQALSLWENNRLIILKNKLMLSRASDKNRTRFFTKMVTKKTSSKKGYKQCERIDLTIVDLREQMRPLLLMHMNRQQTIKNRLKNYRYQHIMIS